MANSGCNTNGSQFFLLFKEAKHLDLKHSVFGRVVGGLANLDKMEEVIFTTTIHVVMRYATSYVVCEFELLILCYRMRHQQLKQLYSCVIIVIIIIIIIILCTYHDW